uniref:Seipin n=1 Tax=Culicoides sonorensis TaxID=179676 RepID=A0A336MJT5_CULSO
MRNVSLISLALTLIDPFKIGRNFVVKPLFNFANNLYDETLEKTKNGVLSVRDIILRVIILLLAIVIVLWTAGFMYVAFYYAYMPSIAHTRPVHMEYKGCDSDSVILKDKHGYTVDKSKDIPGICTYPSAHVSLTRKQQLLMVGQPYRVLVTLEMPESPKNYDAGMFMVCAEMRDHTGKLRGHSCRSAMLHYKSTLHTWISTWVNIPLYLLNFREEKQQVTVELFSSYQDDDQNSVTDVYIEIQSKQIQFYSVLLHITAHFTGLRYFMFHWPILSAAVGICTNLFFIIIVCLMSWYHWSDNGSEWLEENITVIGRRGRLLDRKKSKDDDTVDDDDDVSIIDDLSSEEQVKTKADDGLRLRKLHE